MYQKALFYIQSVSAAASATASAKADKSRESRPTFLGNSRSRRRLSSTVLALIVGVIKSLGYLIVIKISKTMTRLSLLFFIISTICVYHAVANRVMVWMCLEFCDETQDVINANLNEISRNRQALSAVSFEKYTLGPNSTLVDNNLTEVSSEIIAIGLEAWPLLSSYPHPPEFMDWMRTVFKYPKPFIESCISEAKKYNYTGYNLDWEPTDDVTEQDGSDYAAFIETFAKALHAENLKLTADIATWSPIWNYTAIATTSVDVGISMGTYTSTDSSFTSQLETLVTAFGPARSGVGLETVNASTSARMPMDEVAWRFQQITASGAVEVDLWRMPVPPLWWPLLVEFISAA